MTDNYSNGIKYAIEETYDKTYSIEQKLELIKNEQGEEASEEFLQGYYKGLLFFTHAIDYVDFNDAEINEKASHYENNYGKGSKEAFLKGIEYYRSLNEKMKSNKK